MKFIGKFFFLSAVFACFFLIGAMVHQYTVENWQLRKACLYIWPEDENNRIFGINIFYKRLKEEFFKRGYDLATHDINPPYESEIVFYVFARAPLPPKSHKDKSYVWYLETPFSIDVLYNKDKQQLFKKIFTYDKDLVDDKQFYYLRPIYSFDPYEEVNLTKKTVMAMQIAGNLNYSPEHSLYYERRNLVKWFVENHPQDFEFYGDYWKALKSSINGDSQKDFDKCYKGYAKNKKETAKKAKFVFAYENSLSKYYISEKIWDVMNAGSVPVYLGADSIEEYVPKECFINKKDFDNYEKLYDYMKNMSDDTYMAYINCIKTFVSQPKEQNEITDVEGAVKKVIDVIFEKEKFTDWFIYYVNR